MMDVGDISVGLGRHYGRIRAVGTVVHSLPYSTEALRDGKEA